jgi:hypothetical protein
MRRLFTILLLPVAATSVFPVLSATRGTEDPTSAPAVIVDYSLKHDTYGVTGDVNLLSQRFTPGTSLALVIAAAALEAGDLTPETEIPGRSAAPLTLPRALREPNEEFFTQVLKRTGYEPVRRLLHEARFTPGIPEAVASFAELARGEPLRVTVFEQNLFLQALVRRKIPVRPEHCASLERFLALDSRRPAWGMGGGGEISAEGPRFVSWFNGVSKMKDGPHVITVAVVSAREEQAARERFDFYVAGR